MFKQESNTTPNDNTTNDNATNDNTTNDNTTNNTTDDSTTSSRCNNIWNKILNSVYNKPPSLEDKYYLRSLKVVINALTRDFSVVDKSLDGIKRDKLFHIYGTCFKFKYVPSADNRVHGSSVLGDEQVGIIRLSIVEPRIPGIALKFYIDDDKLDDGVEQDLVLAQHIDEQEVPIELTGLGGNKIFKNSIYRTWFDIPVHRHSYVNPFQAIIFPVFREVAGSFSVSYYHLFENTQKTPAPKILLMYPNRDMTLNEIGSDAKKDQSVFTLVGDGVQIGKFYAESTIKQSEYGDKQLHFKHTFFNPVNTPYPLSLIPRFVESIWYFVTRIIKNRTHYTIFYMIYPVLLYFGGRYVINMLRQI